ncbi:MAG: PocR ligand-binding domain-containing protein [Chloroflexi bacterium]|nr:PocR ligand-binding domain-containing protein [Chloroflexota bacterium]
MSDLLTTKQLMDLLHVDRTTIYRMLNDGRLPAVRVGGQWRFQRAAIEQWLAEQHPGATSEPKAITSVAPLPPVEVLPVYCLQPIQEVFAQTSDVGAVTTDLLGKPLTPISNSGAFCNLIRSTAEGRARCEASWQKLADQKDQQPRLEKCHAGLTYARGRVVVRDQFIAMFFVGQFVLDDAKAARASTRLAQIARACAVNEKELARAAQTIRVLEKARAEKLIHLLQLVADTYSHIGEERLDMLTRLKQVAEIARVSTG